MKKDFQKWHGKKSSIDQIEQRPFFHEREVWFCYLGANVGFEQDGQGEDFLRPIVIVKKFNNEIFLGVPLTKFKENKKINKNSLQYYLKFSFIKDIQSIAIISQVRLIDARRLSRNIGVVDGDTFKKLKEKLRQLFPE